MNDSQGPKTKTVEETQTAPRDKERNDQPADSLNESETTTTGKDATTDVDLENIAEQMSHADYPSNDGRRDDPSV